MVHRIFLVVCIIMIFSGCAISVESVPREIVDDKALSSVNDISKTQDMDVNCNTNCYEKLETETCEKHEISNSEEELIYTDYAIELHSISGDVLNLPSDYSCNLNLNIVCYNEISYILKSFSDTYTSIYDPDKFEGSNYVGIHLAENTAYKSINVNDIINDLVVSSAMYSHAFTLSYNGDVIYEYPASASIYLEGEVTLTGILAQSQSPNDYGYNIYGDSIMFFPYAYSLNESDFPSLHSEIINAKFFLNQDEEILFYGETIPFELSNNEGLQNLLNDNKVCEIEVTLSNIEQVWYYGNGSGYSPCSAEIVNFTPHAFSKTHSLE